MDLYQKIIELSEKVDSYWVDKTKIDNHQIFYPVPKDHSRFEVVKSYVLSVSKLSNFHFFDNDLVIIDKGLFLEIEKSFYIHQLFLKPTENSLKTLTYLNKLIAENKNRGFSRLVGIGGG